MSPYLVHVRLQDELISLELTEARFQRELKEMQQSQQAIRNSSLGYESVAALRERTGTRKKEIEQNISKLEEEIIHYERESAQITQEMVMLTRTLESTMHYGRLKELKQRVEVAEAEGRKLKGKFDAQIAERDYQSLKQEV